VHPASPALSKSMGHFQRRRRPRRHWDERATGRFPAVLPIYSRCDLAAYKFDNSPKNKLRVIDFLLDSNGGL